VSVVQKELNMKAIITCLAFVLAAGCAGSPSRTARPESKVKIAFEKDDGLTVHADNVRYEDLVHAVFKKIVELETPKVEPRLSMSSRLANRKASLHLENERSMKKLFAALQQAGDCTMVISEDGNHATFKEK